jgi:hypothetical protein
MCLYLRGSAHVQSERVQARNQAVSGREALGDALGCLQAPASAYCLEEVLDAANRCCAYCIGAQGASYCLPEHLRATALLVPCFCCTHLLALDRGQAR